LAGLDSGAAKNADIVPVRVMKSSGETTAETTTAGVNWVIEHHTTGAAVANISLNFNGNTMLDAAVNNLVSDGVIVVVSAGNGNGNACNGSPARASSAIVVAATTKTDAKASYRYSNYGSCVTLFAPGDAVGGAAYGQFTQLDCSPGLNGTSMAAPLAAGVALIAFALYDDDGYTPAMIKNLLVNRAVNRVTGVPSGTTTKLLQSSVLDCEFVVCSVACSDPRCSGDVVCPPPDH
jgi:subtilisin family serine protease